LSKPIEFDVETTGLQPWSGKQEAFLYCFYDGDDAVALPYSHDDKHNHDEIQKWFDRAEQEGGIRAWNAKFDRAFADIAGFNIPGDGLWHDGMLTANAIDERRSVALKAVASKLLGEESADLQKEVKAWLTAERKRRKKAAQEAGEELVEPTYADVPMSLMEPYALEDVILTRGVCDQYDPIVAQKPDLQGLIEFERKSMDALYAVEKRGCPADEDGYRKLEIEVIENLEELEDRVMELAAEGGMEEFNPKSTPQIIEALKGRGANLQYMSKKNNKLSADADNLRAVDDELAAAILEFRSEYKVLSTYVRPMIGRHYENSMRMWKEPFIAPDGRVHANYRQVGARTGRMSCSDPNMQNQPRDDLRLRYNIRAEPGMKLVSVDLKNIEMVLFAAYAGEGKLLQTVREGGDLHVLTADMLKLKDRVRAGGVFESRRQLGKTYNFSRIYGGGLRTIKRSFRCTQDEARELKKRFDRAYPEVVRLSRRIEHRLAEQGYIQDQLVSGRRWRVDMQEAYKATNYLIQGMAAALFKEALIGLHADGVPVVALVHDEVLAHVPEEDAQEALHLIEKRLTQNEALKEVVPLRADGVIIDRWSDAKPKDDGTLFVPKWAEAA
jgi:DNA polymerase I-like protein with 3'-5' exonuclease and polymerase domains